MAMMPTNAMFDTTTHVTAPLHGHIWVIAGPAGCGKSSIAQCLHESLGYPYLEGDSFHPPANIQKMSGGQALTDADRWDWLALLREESLHALQTSSRQLGGSGGVIVTCSALKRKYRDVLRSASLHHPGVRVRFLFLTVDEEALVARVLARENHYMKQEMVVTQLECLEMPETDEVDVAVVDASKTPVEVRHSALRTVKQVLKMDAAMQP